MEVVVVEEEVLLVVFIVGVVEAALPVGCLDTLAIRTRRDWRVAETLAGTYSGRSFNGLPWMVMAWPKSAGLHPYPIRTHQNAGKPGPQPD